VRILVTNDDGISSVGLHLLARAMTAHGDVVVVAPDREFSGAGAAVGAIHLMQPEVHRSTVDGIDESWAVSGPPALCVFFARLGAFGGPFDLVVSGINPGANVGRSVYHSGTVGACLTARNGGWNGVAVSQAVTGWGVEGQAWDEMLVGQQWDTAAEVASAYVGGLIADGLPAEPVVANINVPNVATADLLGWRRTSIDAKPIRGMSSATLDPIEGQEGSFKVAFDYGEAAELPPDSDGGAVEAGFVSVSYISRLTALDRDDLGGAEAALASFVGG